MAELAACASSTGSRRRTSVGSPMSVASSSGSRVACLLQELQASMADSQDLQRRLQRMRSAAAGLATGPVDDLFAASEEGFNGRALSQAAPRPMRSSFGMFSEWSEASSPRLPASGRDSPVAGAGGAGLRGRVSYSASLAGSEARY